MENFFASQSPGDLVQSERIAKPLAMKTHLFPCVPYKHQSDAMDFIVSRNFYALLMEQGTGKTPILINDAARRYYNGQIDRVLVLAPSGVHSNWVLREIPKHMPAKANCTSAAWYASPSKTEKASLERLKTPAEGLKLLAMNWEALTTSSGLAAAVAFMRGAVKGAMLIGDESQRVKNPSAIRTKRLLNNLSPMAKVRAISSGTAIINSPWDAFSQFGFLDPRILRTASYTTFKAEYAELLPSGHGLLRHIALRTKGRYLPQVVARDAVTGLPKWRNLKQLEQLIAPHSFRVLKKDCLDLPEKLYTTRFFRMTSKQHQRYEALQEDLRLFLDADTVIPVERIAALTKLSQVVSGYFIQPGTDGKQLHRIMPSEENPKLLTLWEEIEECLESDGKVIVWARFRAEIADICALLDRKDIRFVAYHGGVGREDRSDAIDAFQEGFVKVFVGQQAAGGVGITLTAASNVVYYSNSWSLEDRIQSEDRSHRIGQINAVRYVDIVAQNTIDEKIVASLVAKTDLAQAVLGDKTRALALLA